MISESTAMVAIRTNAVAVAAVRREVFTDGLSSADVYGSPGVAAITQRDEVGRPVSSISAPDR